MLLKFLASATTAVPLLPEQATAATPSISMVASASTGPLITSVVTSEASAASGPKPIQIPSPQPWPGVVTCGNRQGLYAGYWQISAYEVVGFIWLAGRVRLTLSNCRPVQMNESGELVGEIVRRYDRQAFRWANGILQPLGFLGGTDGQGGRVSTVAAISAGGVIAGSSTTDTANSHAWRIVRGQMQDLGTLGGNYSTATAVNDLGQVAGASARPDGTTHAFAWSNGRIYDLGTLGGSSSTARAVNNTGWVVGSSATASGGLRAYLWRQGSMTDLGVLPGDQFSEAVAINRQGDVLVHSIGDRQRAFVWTAGRRTEISLPTEGFEPAGLTDNGLVAGTIQAPAGGSRAATWHQGVLRERGSLGGSYSSVLATTVNGALLGSSASVDNSQHAAVWPPDPGA
ncbi:HAF repeat-containing protein [Frankia sp. AgPm24]|uniref:HAF repeat-containing protein n=1 Tax=Frankia sp. AgPm24 TaxID=631128 RepID=UPI00200C8529|nr:HAF repeat-containing protein [Frankia sp. AgPm24]MCK9923011.1 HAF repeat-containing protein [Frankia sp. AgPm24]